jgi:plasmid stabilization system protein ParE
MKIVLAPQAREEFRSQLLYLRDHAGAKTARRLKVRIMTFLNHTLAAYPRIGTAVGHRGLYEVWVPKTRIVVWYRIAGETIQVARFWHAAQDRSQDA